MLEKTVGEMFNALRIAGHLVSGHLYLWQYYVNVTWRTREDCLAWHGRISARPSVFPPPREDCPGEPLKFPVWALSAYREKERLMRQVAAAELKRREQFRKASALLSREEEEAIRLFDLAGRVDVYIPELERLVREHADLLARKPALRSRLRELFLHHWSSKFAKPRYERLPEKMRLAREKWGKGRIEELFS